MDVPDEAYFGVPTITRVESWKEAMFHIGELHDVLTGPDLGQGAGGG